MEGSVEALFHRGLGCGSCTVAQTVVQFQRTLMGVLFENMQLVFYVSAMLGNVDQSMIFGDQWMTIIHNLAFMIPFWYFFTLVSPYASYAHIIHKTLVDD